MITILSGAEAVDFEYFDFKVTSGTEGRVVERQAMIRFTKPYVLVHPDRLTFPAILFIIISQ
jgi:hypothetical protein